MTRYEDVYKAAFEARSKLVDWLEPNGRRLQSGVYDDLLRYAHEFQAIVGALERVRGKMQQAEE